MSHFVVVALLPAHLSVTLRGTAGVFQTGCSPRYSKYAFDCANEIVPDDVPELVCDPTSVMRPVRHGLEMN